MKYCILIICIFLTTGCSSIANEKHQKGRIERKGVIVPLHSYEDYIETSNEDEVSEKSPLLYEKIDLNPFLYLNQNSGNLTYELEPLVYNSVIEGFKIDDIAQVVDFNNFEVLGFTNLDGTYYVYIFSMENLSYKLGNCEFYLNGETNKNSDCKKFGENHFESRFSGQIQSILFTFYPGYKDDDSNRSFDDNRLLLEKLVAYIKENESIRDNYDNSKYVVIIEETLNNN